MKSKFLAGLLAVSVALTGAATPALANGHHHGGGHHAHHEVHHGHHGHRGHYDHHGYRHHHHGHYYHDDDDDFGDVATGLLIGGAIGAMIDNASHSN